MNFIMHPFSPILAIATIERLKKPKGGYLHDRKETTEEET